VTREHIAGRIFGRDQRRERERVAEGEAAEFSGREFSPEKLSALDSRWNAVRYGPGS
jgi:hypothetical protein